MALLGVLAAMAVGFGGCSLQATSTLSARSLESMIAGQLGKSYHIAQPPVHCPTGVPDKIGSQFTCTAKIDGQSLRLAGRVTNTGGGVELRPTSAVVVISAAEQRLAASLTKTFGHQVDISCAASALLVAQIGHAFKCTALVEGFHRQVVVTVTDLQGHLRYRVLPYKAAAARTAQAPRPARPTLPTVPS